MSRIGKMPISIPGGVKIEINKNVVTVIGPKGELTREFPNEITIVQEGSLVLVSRPSDSMRHRSLHGLVRALLNNMVLGVSQGFIRKLQIDGVGYRAEKQGENLVLNVGFSHPVIFEPKDHLGYQVEKGGHNLSVEGIDKELVGEIAARIRRVRPPEPYKGKGIHYEGEHVRHKAGKSGMK